MSSDDIRKSLLIIKENESSTQEVLNEASPMGFLQTLSGAAKALFSDDALDTLSLSQKSKKMYSTYMSYLNRVGDKPGSENIGELYKFLIYSGIPEYAVLKGLSKGLSQTGTPVSIKNKKDLINWWNTNISPDNYKSKLGSVMLAVSQESERIPAEDDDAEDFDQRSKQGAAAVGGLEASAAKNKKPAGKSSNKDVEKTVADIFSKAFGGQDPAAITASIDKALGVVAESEELDEIDLKGLASKAAGWAKDKVKQFTPSKEKEKIEPSMGSITDPEEPQAASSSGFNTGNAQVDAALEKLEQTHGAEAVKNALLAYKKSLQVKSADPFNKYKGEIRKLAGIKDAKPLPVDKTQSFANELRSDLSKLVKGDKESGMYAAKKILQFAKAGYDVSKQANAWLGSAKQGERFLTASEYRDITNMLREFNLDWRDVGLTVKLDESIKSGVFISEITIEE